MRGGMDGFELKIGEVRYEGKGISINQVDKNYLGTQESPIVVHVDTDTDWPSIIPAGAGVVVALLVAWLTIGVQKNQIQGNISNFRHQWMMEFRAVASELIQVMTLLVNNIYRNKDYKKSGGEFVDKCAQMSLLRAKIELLLSRDDAGSDAIRTMGTKLVRRIASLSFDDEKEYDLLLADVGGFKNLIRKELEAAWVDMKNDLGINRRFLIFKMFRRSM
jgi:hypothetical protein